MTRLLICGALAALVLGAGSARAEVVSNTILSFDSIRGQDCTGDMIELSGELHLLARQSDDGSFGGHMNYVNVTGTALGSGASYRAASTDSFQVDFAAGDVQSVSQIRLVGQGSEANLLVTLVTHVTTNANGEVTAEVSEIRTACV